MFSAMSSAVSETASGMQETAGKYASREGLKQVASDMYNDPVSTAMTVASDAKSLTPAGAAQNLGANMAGKALQASGVKLPKGSEKLMSVLATKGKGVKDVKGAIKTAKAQAQKEAKDAIKKQVAEQVKAGLDKKAASALTKNLEKELKADMKQFDQCAKGELQKAQTCEKQEKQKKKDDDKKKKEEAKKTKAAGKPAKAAPAKKK